MQQNKPLEIKCLELLSIAEFPAFDYYACLFLYCFLSLRQFHYGEGVQLQNKSLIPCGSSLIAIVII
jgi:hypothetical protein